MKRICFCCVTFNLESKLKLLTVLWRTNLHILVIHAKVQYTSKKQEQRHKLFLYKIEGFSCLQQIWLTIPFSYLLEKFFHNRIFRNYFINEEFLKTFLPFRKGAFCLSATHVTFSWKRQKFFYEQFWLANWCGFHYKMSPLMRLVV